MIMVSLRKSLRRLWRRLCGTLFRSRRDEDFGEEIEHHIRMLTDDNIRRGMASDAAHRAAVLTFGGIESTKEAWRDQRRLPAMDTILRDVRFAVRGLAKERSFAAVCALILGLGIGATTGMFSIVNAVLIRPLPYPAAHQLVQVWETNPQANRWGDWASYPDFEDWRRQNRAFEGMAAFRYGRLRLASGDYPEMLTAVRVSPDMFSVLRVSPLLGRTFLAEEDTRGRSDVAVLSYGLWQRQFGSDPAIVGRTIPIDGRSHLVIGVMPPAFDFPTNLQPTANPPDLWVPLTADRSRGSHNYRVIARLRPDRTLAQAQTDMNRVMEVIANVDAGHRGRGSAVAGLQQHAVATARPALFLMMGAIVVVLMIACANVANLLLARGVSKHKEVALRLALGATPLRVLQQILTESLVLATLGALVGVLVAFAGVRLFVQFAPAVPLAKTVSVDARVLAFVAIVSFAVSIAFGLLPALHALNIQANEALRDTATRQAGGARHTRARTVLTVVELALSIVLMIGASLLMRSFLALRTVDVGFEPDKLVTGLLTAPPAASTSPDRVVGFFADVIASVARIPGVVSVAGASAVPLMSNESSPFRTEGAAPSIAGDVYAEQPKITPEYFRAMGIRTLSGRGFGSGDTREALPVAIVSKTLADTYWPRENPIGKRLQIDDQQWREVVGVVDDVRHDGLDRPQRPTIYIPFAQYPRATLTILVRCEADPATVVGAMRRAIMAINRDQPLFGIQMMEQTVSQSLSTRRFLTVLVGLFAAVSALMGTVGVYGVLAYFVGQRRRELAIRAVLGATQSEVIQIVVRQGLLLASLGVTIGVLGALALSRLIAGLLFGISPTDGWTFVGVPALLLIVVVAASYLPARAAGRVEPITILRGE